MSLAEIETRLFINNEFTQGLTQSQFTLKNPSTGKDSISVYEAHGRDVEVAVKHAESAWKSWAELDAWKRAEAVTALANLIVQNAAKFAELDSLCMGIPVGLYSFQAMASAAILKYNAGIGVDVAGKTSLMSANHLNLTLKQPYGVTATIIPWNTPLLIAAASFAPAVMAGNAIIIKSSEKAPLSMILLAKLVQETGLFPSGVVQILTGGSSTGSAIAQHPRIRKLAFTGSLRTGQIVKKLAAESNLKNVTLELGGKSPLIVFPDANLEKAVSDAALSIGLLSGQTCIASSRVYVHKDVMSHFQKKFVATFKAVLGKAGDPLNPETTHGPQVDEIQFQAISKVIKSAKESGLVPVTGGKSLDREGYFIEPTVYVDPPDAAEVVQKEIFGPVVVLSSFTDEDEVLLRANSTEYGLYASIYTKDIQRALRLAKRLESGTVAINATSPLMASDIAFGGCKSSGDGRQFGREGLESWLETKGVLINLA